MKSLALLTVVIFVGLVSNAEARKRGVGIVGWGDDISHIADHPDDPAAPAVGLYYSSFRLFYVPLVTWNKEYVIYDDDTYWELDDEMLATVKADVGGLALKGNLWVKLVNWLWPAAIVGIFVRRYIRKKQCERIDAEYAHLHQ